MADAVEDAAGRLYGLPLEDFTRERDATARALRKEKQRDAAAAVGKLPKPSQAAWAANHLARERRELVDALLEAGEALREAQEAALGGQGSGPLRDAAAAERTAVEALVDAARELRPGGRKPSEATLERLRTTLHAAAADDDVRAALDAGRLVEDVAGGGAWGLIGGFGGGETPQAAPEAKPERRKASPKTDEDRAAAAREREERQAAEREARERRRAIEADLREARAERRARERELGRAEREADRAQRRLDDALAAVDDARAHLDEARDDVETARAASEQARDEVARLEEQLD